jgi:hypothetical protein
VSNTRKHRVTNCPNWGAQIEVSDTTQATTCPFCDTPGRHRHRHQAGQIKPQGLIPFQLDEKTARAAMTDWLGRLWFAPNGLQEYARKGRAMNGIYVPYWTFDAQTATDYRGQRGDHYYETRTVMRDGKRETVQVRKTRWRAVRGHVTRFFDDVLVLASRSLPKHYTDALEPWDLSRLVTYQPQYLSGFNAEGYQVELEEGLVQAREIMDRVIVQDIRRDIGGDEQQISAKDTRISDVTFKHVLLPVWLAAYKYNDKTFRFVVNGQTGRVQGERPYSWIKITIAVVLGLIVAGARRPMSIRCRSDLRLRPVLRMARRLPLGVQRRRPRPFPRDPGGRCAAPARCLARRTGPDEPMARHRARLERSRRILSLVGGGFPPFRRRRARPARPDRRASGAGIRSHLFHRRPRQGHA